MNELKQLKDKKSLNNYINKRIASAYYTDNSNSNKLYKKFLNKSTDKETKEKFVKATKSLESISSSKQIKI